ncbi:MAG TPA: nodulation protein NfeD [Anaeromyxobacter sp.]|nr:nodulation protein NfeD [Anaeromyxobacter sp.]
MLARVVQLLVLGALAASAGSAASPAGTAAGTRAAGPPRVLTATVDGAITLGTAEYLEAALSRAKDEGFEALLIELDTPGGDLESTRKIVRGMLESPVPVLVWVGPAGAHAGSAGVFVALAGDVTAMHPTSNIGAAHPVTGSGRDVEAEAGKDMAKKVENDTAAFVRSVATARGRNAAWAERAVRESVAITADEAVKEKVADFLAGDPETVLSRANGRTVRAGSSPKVLRLEGAVLVPHAPTIRQRSLMFIANPNVVAILTLLGLLGLGIEFYHPGALFPGVAGGFCLFLVFVASQLIPVNVAAVLLLLAGTGLLVSEAYFTSHGLAGVGGAACLVLGLLFFLNTSAPDQSFDPGALSLSPWVVWPTPIALAAVFAFMGWKVARGRRVPLQLGAPALLGARGESLSEVGPEGGEVFLHGEYWSAKSLEPIGKGVRVRVVGVEGLVVTVEADPAMR